MVTDDIIPFQLTDTDVLTAEVYMSVVVLC